VRLIAPFPSPSQVDIVKRFQRIAEKGEDSRGAFDGRGNVYPLQSSLAESQLTTNLF
jgi:hypothetical protein